MRFSALRRKKIRKNDATQDRARVGSSGMPVTNLIFVGPERNRCSHDVVNDGDTQAAAEYHEQEAGRREAPGGSLAPVTPCNRHRSRIPRAAPFHRPPKTRPTCPPPPSCSAFRRPNRVLTAYLGFWLTWNRPHHKCLFPYTSFSFVNSSARS